MFILLRKKFVQVQPRFFLVEPEPETCPHNMEEVGGTVIETRGGTRSGRGGQGGSARSACLRRSSSVNTVVPVPPSPSLSSPHTAASITLASMSMTAPTTPMLVSGHAEEVKDSTGSDKDSPTETEVPAGVSLQDRERKNKDKERKRKDREAAKQKAFPPVHIGVIVSASSPAPSTVIQLRSSPTKELRAGAAATLNGLQETTSECFWWHAPSPCRICSESWDILPIGMNWKDRTQ